MIYIKFINYIVNLSQSNRNRRHRKIKTSKGIISHQGLKIIPIINKVSTRYTSGENNYRSGPTNWDRRHMILFYSRTHGSYDNRHLFVNLFLFDFFFFLKNNNKMTIIVRVHYL